MILKKKPFLILSIIFFTCFFDIFFLNKTINPFFFQEYGSTVNLENNYPHKFNNVEQGTGIFYEQPIKKFYGNSIKKLEYPLWNEHQAGGYSLFNQFSNNGLNPFFLIESLFDERFYDLFIFIKIVMGAYGVYLLNRFLGQKNVYMLYISSIIYGLSAIFLWFSSLQQMIFFGAIFPYTVLFTLKSIDKKKLTIAAIFFNTILNYLGQPEVAFYCFIFQTFLLLGLNLNSIKTLYESIKLLFLTYLFTLLLSLPNILPQLDWLNYADNSLHLPGGGSGLASPSPLVFLKIIFFPYISYLNTENFHFPVNGFWDSIGGYVIFSLLSLILIAVQSLNKSKNTLLLTLSLCFILIINFKNFGIYPFYEIGKLPIFDQVWSNRWSNVSWLLSLSIFIGNLNLKRLHKNKYKFILFILISLSVISFYWLQSVIPNGDKFIHGENFQKLNFSIIKSHIYLFNIFICLSSIIVIGLFLINHKKKFFLTTVIIFINYLTVFPKNYSSENFGFLMILLFGIICFFCLAKRIRIYHLLAIPLTTLFITSIDNNLPNNNKQFDTHEYIAFLKEINNDYSRISGANGILFGNTASAYNLDDISGIMALPLLKFSEHYWSINNNLFKNDKINHSKPPWFSGLSNFRAIHKDRTNVIFVENITDINNIRYLSEFSVKYFIFPKPNKLNDEISFIKEIYNDEYVVIYKNLLAKPRFSTINKEDCTKVDNKLYCNTEYFKTQILLPKISKNNKTIFDACDLNDKYIITTNIHGPGWESNNNILELNNMFRAIEITNFKNCNNIYMEYFPPQLKNSLYIMVITMLLIFTIYKIRWIKFL